MQILNHSSIMHAFWSHTHSQTKAGVLLKTGKLQFSTPPVHFTKYTSHATASSRFYFFTALLFYIRAYQYSAHKRQLVNSIAGYGEIMWDLRFWGWQCLNIVQYVALAKTCSVWVLTNKRGQIGENNTVMFSTNRNRKILSSVSAAHLCDWCVHTLFGDIRLSKYTSCTCNYRNRIKAE